MPQFLSESILVAPFLRNSWDGLRTGENGVSGFDPGLEFRKLRLFGMMRVVFISFITITLELDSCWKPSFEELSFSIWCIDMDFSDITFGREWVLFYLDCEWFKSLERKSSENPGNSRCRQCRARIRGIFLVRFRWNYPKTRRFEIREPKTIFFVAESVRSAPLNATSRSVKIIREPLMNDQPEKIIIIHPKQEKAERLR